MGGDLSHGGLGATSRPGRRWQNASASKDVRPRFQKAADAVRTGSEGKLQSLRARCGVDKWLLLLLCGLIGRQCQTVRVPAPWFMLCL